MLGRDDRADVVDAEVGCEMEELDFGKRLIACQNRSVCTWVCQLGR